MGGVIFKAGLEPVDGRDTCLSLLPENVAQCLRKESTHAVRLACVCWPPTHRRWLLQLLRPTNPPTSSES